MSSVSCFANNIPKTILLDEHLEHWSSHQPHTQGRGAKKRRLDYQNVFLGPLAVNKRTPTAKFCDRDSRPHTTAVVGFTAMLEPDSRPNLAAGHIEMWFGDRGGLTSLSVCTFEKVDLRNPPVRKLAKSSCASSSGSIRMVSSGLISFPLAFASLWSVTLLR